MDTTRHALISSPQGYLAEAFASHAAVVKDGVLRTPFVRCCPDGVTRRVVLELCKAEGIEAHEANLTRNDVAGADELLVLGTMSGPVPVTRLDGIAVGDGRVGPLTTRLSVLYQQAQLDPQQCVDMELDS